jgi:hypothetical protein
VAFGRNDAFHFPKPLLILLRRSEISNSLAVKTKSTFAQIESNNSLKKAKINYLSKIFELIVPGINYDTIPTKYTENSEQSNSIQTTLSSSPSNPDQTQQPKIQPEAIEPTNWNYSSYRDEMRGITFHLAEIKSNEFANLPFPWTDPAQLSIHIRKSGGHFEVAITSNSGQFQFGTLIYIISTRSDKGKIMEWSANRSDKKDMRSMFVRQSDAFIRTMAKSERFILEVDFYNVGKLQFTFNPRGLEQRFLP